MSDDLTDGGAMQLVTEFSATTLNVQPQELVELDVARDVWSSDQINVNRSEEEEFNAKLSSETGVLQLPETSFPKLINYRIVNENRSLVLQPMQLNNNFNIKYHDLKINLPDSVKANCFVINYVEIDKDIYIVIDIITKSGITITIMFSNSQFLVKKFNLNSTHYKDWCKISNPYGFDIREPHLLYSYSYDLSIVLLKDGGIIGLKKHLLNKNSDLEIESIIFNDNSYLENLTSYFKFSNENKSNKIFTNSNLSEKCVIDILKFEDFLITITINKKLRVWSIKNKNLIFEMDLNLKLQNIQNNKDYFDPNPTTLLNYLEINNRHFLTIYLPFNNGIFKIFEIENLQGSLKINDLGKNFEFNCNLKNEKNSIWLVSDFKLIKSSKFYLQLWVLYKSNTSSIIQTLQINEDLSSHWLNVTTSNSIEFLSKKNNLQTFSEFYIDKIFESNIYTNDIIKTVLPIYSRHVLNQELVIENLSLRELVIKNIGKSIKFDENYEENLFKQWKRFDSLCNELKKQYDEPLKIFIDNSSDLIFIINKFNYKVIRNLSEIELIKNNDNDNIEYSKFITIIGNFRKTISTDVLNNIKNSINLILTSKSNESVSLNEKFNLIFENELKNKLNPINLTNLTNELLQFKDILRIIDNLINLINPKVDRNLFNSSKLTNLSYSIILQSLIEIVSTNKKFLFDLMLILIVLEFNQKDEINVKIGKLLSIYKSYEIFRLSLTVNFDDSDKLETNLLPNLNKSLFIKFIDFKFKNGFEINQEELVGFINLINNSINSNDFIYFIISKLIELNLNNVIRYKFLKYFDDSPVFNVFKAIVYFKNGEDEKSCSLFIKESLKISQYKLSKDEAIYFQNLSEFKLLFQTNLSKYYLNLSRLFLNNLKFQSALRLIQVSIKNNNNDDYKLLEEKYFTLFSIAIEISNFELAINASNNLSDESIKEEARDALIYKMYKVGEIRKITELEFNNDFTKVDSILLKMARSYKDVKKSLYFYKVLYSFRLNYNNYRGSLESLYEFISRFCNNNNNENDDKINSIIQDLYLIILNLLVTMEKDDQWIINDNKVLSYDDITTEYHSLLTKR